MAHVYVVTVRTFGGDVVVPCTATECPSEWTFKDLFNHITANDENVIDGADVKLHASKPPTKGGIHVSSPNMRLLKCLF